MEKKFSPAPVGEHSENKIEDVNRKQNKNSLGLALLVSTSVVSSLSLLRPLLPVSPFFFEVHSDLL